MTQNNFFWISLKNSQPLHCEEQFCSFKSNKYLGINIHYFRFWTNGLWNHSFIHYHTLLLLHMVLFWSNFFIKMILNFWDMRTICSKIFAELGFFPQSLKLALHILYWKYFEHFGHFLNCALLTQFFISSYPVPWLPNFFRMKDNQYYLKYRNFLAITYWPNNYLSLKIKAII